MDIPSARLMPPGMPRVEPPQVSGAQPNAAQPQPPSTEPLLNARVITARPASGGGWILELALDGETIDARSPHPLPGGTHLLLQPLSVGRVRVAQILPAQGGAQLLTQALRSALPLQLPLHEALATLAAAARDPGLPPPLAERLRELLARAPSAQRLASAQGLRSAVLDSGGFLEARLQRLGRAGTRTATDTTLPRDTSPGRSGDARSAGAPKQTSAMRSAGELLASLRRVLGSSSELVRPAVPTVAGTSSPVLPGSRQGIANDLKAGLLGTLAELTNTVDSLQQSVPASARPQAQASNTPILYGRQQPPGASPLTSMPDAETPGARPARPSPHAAPAPGSEATQTARLIEEILLAVRGALARTRVHQIAAHPDNPHQPENPPLQTWSVELPITRSGGFDALELRIEDHGAGRDTDDTRQRTWQVQLRLQLEELGTLHARLVLNGERLATTLWLADPQALARARATLAELGDLLRAQGVEVTRLDCLEGAPAVTPSATRLLEVRT